MPKTFPSNLLATDSHNLSAISAATFLAEKFLKEFEKLWIEMYKNDKYHIEEWAKGDLRSKGPEL